MEKAEIIKGLIEELKAANNGIEQPFNYYVNLISLAKNALEEVKKFTQSTP